LTVAKSNEPVEATQEVAYIPLYRFAQDFAKKYGVEMMGGFYHTQETAKPPHLADTEDNWHKLIQAYAKKEVR